MIPATHYQHSGKAPLGGTLLTLVGGLVAGAILGAVYGFLIYWSPFVYINAFITQQVVVFLAPVEPGGRLQQPRGRSLLEQIVDGGKRVPVVCQIAMRYVHVIGSVFFKLRQDAALPGDGSVTAVRAAENDLIPIVEIDRNRDGRLFRRR